MNLEYLISNQCFRTAQLLKLDDFIKLCKHCLIPIDKEQLEYYERRKIFFPIARVRFPWQSPFHSSGATYVFNWDNKQPINWYSEKILWEPMNRRFLPWNHFTNKLGYAQYESYYSRFQIFHYHRVQRRTTFTTKTSSILRKEYNDRSSYQRKKTNAKNAEISLVKKRVEFEQIAWLCQCISDYYFPSTQSNMRRLSYSSSEFDWDWNEYRRAWKPKLVLKNMGLTQSDLENIHCLITGELSVCDPLFSWHDLITLINIDKRRKLKGDALYAQQLYAMEMMIRLYYKDLFRKQLPAPYYENLTNIPYNHGVTDEKTSLPYLRYTANKYSINPQPKMLLICEGKSDQILYTEIIKNIFGRAPEVLGLEFIDIHGVGNAVGSKKSDKRLALKHLIDYQHHLLTIVFVALDNEGGAEKMLKRLCEQQSIWDHDRKVTCQEYTWVWKKQIEYDNFSNAEIAIAMNKVAKTKDLFSEKDVEVYSTKNGDTISELFKSKTGLSSSPKPELAMQLATLLERKCEQQENPYRSNLPILMMMRRIIWMCTWHMLPNSLPE